MSKILVIAEHDGKKLIQATARCVTCARQVPGGSVTVAVLLGGVAVVYLFGLARLAPRSQARRGLLQRSLQFAAGIATLAFALLSPLDTWGVTANAKLT